MIDHDNLEDFRDPQIYDLEDKGYYDYYPSTEQWARSLGGPLLDLAYGTGRMALRMAALGYAVTGVDITPEMIEQLTLFSRCYHSKHLRRRGRRRCAIAVAIPILDYKATLLRYITLKHPAQIAVARKPIDSIDLLLSYPGRRNKLIRRKI